MQLTYDLQHGTVLVWGDGTVEIQYKGKQDSRAMCLDLSRELAKLLIPSQDRTADELDAGLRNIQEIFVSANDYDRAMLCRDARRVIERLADRNEMMREELRRVTTPVSARVKPEPEIED